MRPSSTAPPGIGIWQWASNDQGVAPDVVMACCGDVPTLETLAAVSILREHLPDLKIRVVNVVDLMKLQPQREHPHGLSDTDFDELFTKDKPVIFAFHGYPWLIHRLTYRRTNHDNIHVRGYKEEGTITTPFDMTVLNDLDRFHLVMDAIDRLPQTGDKGIYLKQQLKDKLIEHKQYIDKYGEDLPEIRNWKWRSRSPQRIVTMQTGTKEPAEESPPSEPTTAKTPIIASVPVPGGNGAHYSAQLLEKARADTDTVLKELGSQLGGLSAGGSRFSLEAGTGRTRLPERSVNRP